MESKEIIKVMKHYEKGGEIEFKRRNENNTKWRKRLSAPFWDWRDFDYRIRATKQEITIEKWLCSNNNSDFIVIETSDIDACVYIAKKVKLLESYRVEL